MQEGAGGGSTAGGGVGGVAQPGGAGAGGLGPLGAGGAAAGAPGGSGSVDAGSMVDGGPGDEAGTANYCGGSIEELVEAEGLACADDLGDPVPGTDAWAAVDLNNQECAAKGTSILANSPAAAAATEANIQAGDDGYFGDPFRAPNRWAGQRGSYELVSFTERGGTALSAVLLGPLDPDRGPYPGVLVVCHICLLAPTAEGMSAWFWAAESLAEAGYVVMYFANAGNALESAIDATDFFVATPDSPSPRGEFNPWHTQLDRSRLAIIGHSGAGGVSLGVGLTDPRFDAIVAWDPAGSSTLPAAMRQTPTMIQVADYSLDAGPVPRDEKPTPEAAKYTFFDTLSAAGIDSMQIAPRASTHIDWQHYPSTLQLPHGIFGEMVGMYYTLAWLDRYLTPARQGLPSQDVATDALRRLTASGTDCFDSSADLYSIGTGFFDPDEADRTGDVESGNVPIQIGGLPIRNLLSHQYDSKYFLDGGALQCDDMRSGCTP